MCDHSINKLKSLEEHDRLGIYKFSGVEFGTTDKNHVIMEMSVRNICQAIEFVVSDQVHTNTLSYLQQFLRQMKLLNLLVPYSTRHSKLHFAGPPCDLIGFQYS